MNHRDCELVQEVAGQPEARLRQVRALVRLATILAVVLGMGLRGYAQEAPFEVKCTVVDEKGAVIPYAKVAFKGQSGTTVLHSGADGVATQALPAGRYTVEVNHIGFFTTIMPHFNVGGATQPPCRIPLKVGDRPTDSPERRPAQHVDFPRIKQWNSLRISLRRTVCFGTCPSYSLTVLGDGSVIYYGDGFVHYCGDYRGKVSQQVVHQLVDVFRKADYFRLFSRYAATASDLPTYITSIAFDDKVMSVTDYWGIRVGMPDAVTEVENTIDRLAGPQVWTKGVDSHVECENSLIPKTISDVPNKIQTKSPH